jgi:hypothetical protein
VKRFDGNLDALPSKRLYLSIIADYDLNKSVCELVDNAFDMWTRGGRHSAINIDVILDADEPLIRVTDDAGGIARDELEYIVGPGQTGSAPTDETIGIFGVGTKRAVVALARDVRIRTRHGSARTYQVEFDDEWIKDDDNWSLPRFRVDDIAPGTTEVELRGLRVDVGAEAARQLRAHLGAIYARFIAGGNVRLRVNGEPAQARFFDDWSYPPSYEPRRYRGELRVPNARVIRVEVTAGLSSESSPASGEYGVYFYCNDRLVAPAMKSFDVGFSRGQAGLPHPKISLTKVIVSLNGDAGEMPWNSSKSDISTKHHVFVALREWLVTVVADYARVSRALEGEWPAKVFAYSRGNIVDEQIADFPTARRSFLPDPPPSRPRLAARMADRNRQLARRHPWVKALYEGVVASAVVARQPLEHANWLAFNLLDLTLTAAFKTYLVNSKPEISSTDLRKLLARSPKVSPQLRSAIPLEDEKWSRIQNMARRRDDLTYGQGVANLGDEEFAAAEELVREVLAQLFEINFE